MPKNVPDMYWKKVLNVVINNANHMVPASHRDIPKYLCRILQPVPKFYDGTYSILKYYIIPTYNFSFPVMLYLYRSP